MGAKVICHLLRLLLGGVFLIAGVVKIWDFHANASATPAFYEAIANYHMDELGPIRAVLGRLPGTASDLTMLAAIYLPWLEVVLGLALLLRRATAGAAAISAALMALFIAALATAWSRGLDISCGCFGREDATTNYPWHLLLDVFWLVSAMVIAWRERLVAPPAGPDPSPSPGEPGQVQRTVS